MSVVFCVGLFPSFCRDRNTQEKRHIEAQTLKMEKGVAKSLKNDTLLKAQLKTCSIWKKGGSILGKMIETVREVG